MKTVITKGITGDARKEIVQEWVASAHLRKHIIAILEDKIRVNTTKRIREDDYTNPNWSYLQADHVGYIRAMKEFISILSSENV